MRKSVCRILCFSNDRVFFFWAHEPIADTFASRTFLVAVISGCFAIRTFFPIVVLHGTCIGAVAAFPVNRLAAATVYNPSLITRRATLGTDRDR